MLEPLVMDRHRTAVDLAESRYGSPMLSGADLLPLPPGLVAVTDQEGVGKTVLLRGLCEQLAGVDRQSQCAALWLDLALPGQDDETPGQVWAALRQRCPLWDEALQRDLIEALGLQPHLDKTLFMLSTGSRRKVALVGLLASGATCTCLDLPFAGLDAASIRVIRDFLIDVADHPTRTWVVADYEVDLRLPWRKHIALS